MEGAALAEANKGVSIPGWKLVHAKTNRKWIAGAADKLFALLGDAAYDKKLIGLTAADKLARESAKKATNPPLSVFKARRKFSSKSVELGCVPMSNQRLSIRIITEYNLKAQRLFKYKYEVVSEDSPYFGNIDIVYAEREIMLGATHCYSVKFNDNPNNPRIVEVIEELPKG